MQVGWVKIGDFQQIAGYISKTVQYRCIHFLLKSNRKSYALYRIVTLPGHKIGAIRQDTCDFLLVFRCNYISILYRFWDISTYVPKFSGATWPWMHYRITVCKAILFTFNLQTKFEMSSFIRSNDMAWAPKVEMGHVTLTTPVTGWVWGGFRI